MSTTISCEPKRIPPVHQFWPEEQQRFGLQEQLHPITRCRVPACGIKKYRHILGTSFGGDLPVGLTVGQAIDRSFDHHKTEFHR